MLDLYHAEPAANSLKVLLAIKEKGVPFTSHFVNLHEFQQHEPWYVKINPNGQVPALIHAGKVITESTVINEYLDEVCDGEDRAHPAQGAVGQVAHFGPTGLRARAAR